MGGLIFSKPGPNGSPALKTPRMTPAVYEGLKEKYTGILNRYYKAVVTPPEAPAKEDHGDVDFIVAGPLQGLSMQQLASEIGAKRWVSTGPTHSFAVAVPDADDLFAQLDIIICQEENFAWDCFMKSWGDMWHIISVVHNKTGLTATDQGLFIRIPELESEGSKKSRLYLTNSPREATEFMGLDFSQYQRGFKDEEELFTWCISGRFPGHEEFSHLVRKANDRHRLKTRVMYRRFVEEWAPNHIGQVPERDILTRSQVLQLAIDRFAKKAEYGALLKKWADVQNERLLWQKITSVIPRTGSGLGLAIRSLKRWVTIQDGKPVIMEVAEVEHDNRELWNTQLTGESEASLLSWVAQNWELVRSKEKERSR